MGADSTNQHMNLILYNWTETQSQQRQRWSLRETASNSGKVRNYWLLIYISASQATFPSTFTTAFAKGSSVWKPENKNISAGTTAETKVQGERKTVLTSKENCLRPTNTDTKYKSFRVHTQFYQSGINQKHLKIRIFHIKHVSGNS